jgi:hypothetical protein
MAREGHLVKFPETSPDTLECRPDSRALLSKP